MMLTQIFLAKASIAFVKKFLGDDDYGTKKFTIGDGIGTFIGSLALNVTGSSVYAGGQLIAKNLKQNGLPINNEMQRSVRAAFLSSAAEAARFLNRNKLLIDQQQEKSIKKIIDYLNEEQKNSKNKNYLLYEDDLSTELSGYFSHKKLEDEVTNEELSQELNESLFKELELHFYAKEFGNLPNTFLEVIRNGWEENSKIFSFFTFMCDYFYESIKHDKELRAALQTEWLTQILVGTQEIKSEIGKILHRLETYFEKLGEQSIAVSGKLDEIILLLKPQPKLFYNYNSIGFNKTNFKNRSLNLFVGRDEQLKQLTIFFENKERFLWTAASGSGGIGKSRLALEFCFELSYLYTTVNKGFINNLNSFNWLEWEPTAPTFIIIDYAAGYYIDIIKVLQTLSDKKEVFNFPVRFLLLERQTEGMTWWEEIQNQIGRKIDKNTQYLSPIRIGSLQENDLWEIIVKVLLENSKPLPSKEETLNSLKKIDNQGRPLFALFAAYALAAGEDMNNWDANDLLQSYVDRENSRIYESLTGNKSKEEKFGLLKLITLHKNLAAIATILKGLSQNQTEDILIKGYEWLPTKENFSSTILKYIVDANDVNNNFLQPIEPDILGEYFVLKQMEKDADNPFINENKGLDMSRLAWNSSPQQVFLFTLKVFEDFRSNQTKEILITKPNHESTYEYKKWWARLIVDLTSYFGKQDVKYAIPFYNAIKEFAEQNSLSELWMTTADSAFNIINNSCKQDSYLAVTYYIELKEMSQKIPAREILMQFSKAAVLLTWHMGRKNPEMGLSYYNELKQVAEKHPFNGIRLSVAQAAGRLIANFSEAKSSTAFQYYEELKVFSRQHSYPGIFDAVSEAGQTLNFWFGRTDSTLGFWL